uniref:Uncharacterized protein n=1 Tax=Faecalibaculum rodentium TaxID=1702221 RepID=A0A140DYD2_9FIRM|nr:hypothetical protein AALO17_25250 [Faecalibaculum rodentium]
MRQLPPDRSQTSVLYTRKFMKPPLFPGEKRQRRFSAVFPPFTRGRKDPGRWPDLKLLQ